MGYAEAVRADEDTYAAYLAANETRIQEEGHQAASELLGLPLLER